MVSASWRSFRSRYATSVCTCWVALSEPKSRTDWISEAQSTSCFLNWRQTKARISRRSGTCCSWADPRSENGISDSVPSRLSITTVRERTPRGLKRAEPESSAGL